MIKYQNQWLDILIGAIALYLGGPAMQHWLSYYRYPHMRCISLFEPKFLYNKDEGL
jgi:hypothetical protein